MCTYATMQAAIDGSAKGPNGSWFHVTDATVYFDHPVHAMADHTLNIDFAAPDARPVGPGRGRAHRGVGARTRRRDPGRAGQRTGGPRVLTASLGSSPCAPPTPSRSIPTIR